MRPKFNRLAVTMGLLCLPAATSFAVDPATVTAKIVTDREAVETLFTLQMGTHTVTLQPAVIATDDEARADLYRMALLADPRFRLVDIACLRAPDDNRLPAEITVENQSIVFAPGDGAHVDCTFQLASLDDVRLSSTTGSRADSAGGPPTIIVTPPGDGPGAIAGGGGGGFPGRLGNETPAPGGIAASCSAAGALIAASEQARNEVVPCDFDIPATWAAQAGIDGTIASIITQSCESCAEPAGIQLTIGSGPNANADAMEESWAQMFTVVGSGSCGQGSVTFYSPPGDQSGATLGSVMFHVALAEGKHSGSAQFRCPAPGAWKALQAHFIKTFKDNPDSTFPNR